MYKNDVFLKECKQGFARHLLKEPLRRLNRQVWLYLVKQEFEKLYIFTQSCSIWAFPQGKPLQEIIQTFYSDSFFFAGTLVFFGMGVSKKDQKNIMKKLTLRGLAWGSFWHQSKVQILEILAVCRTVSKIFLYERYWTIFFRGMARFLHFKRYGSLKLKNENFSFRYYLCNSFPARFTGETGEGGYFDSSNTVLPLLFEISGLEFLSDKLENLMNSCTY